jgi:hypothetical protein
VLENTISFLWLVAIIVLPLALLPRLVGFAAGFPARMQGRGPCPRFEPREGCRCNHCRGRCLCASDSLRRLNNVMERLPARA